MSVKTVMGNADENKVMKRRRKPLVNGKQEIYKKPNTHEAVFVPKLLNKHENLFFLFFFFTDQAEKDFEIHLELNEQSP